MIGHTISHHELTLWSPAQNHCGTGLSKIREGRIGLASASPSLTLEKGTGGDELGGGLIP